MKIGKLDLNKNKKPILISEISGNHGGKFINAVELVKNKETKEPYPDLAKKLGPLYNKYQMIGLPSPIGIQLAPPISVTKDEIDDLVERVESVIKDLN